ncbi:hypothetical protein QBC46DRAFT_395912 [Diplogelasinospora grovesii]|uniref:Uncharacterized protein n=1 Tax=Diplogelasinospora grovesii TaxID=303347 RepID=A0AAN6N0U1_9PEZI|nr:hypothetical protein QBC46DRAFT_395912 [Diplogelasinospora grovesii]
MDDFAESLDEEKDLLLQPSSHSGLGHQNQKAKPAGSDQISAKTRLRFSLHSAITALLFLSSLFLLCLLLRANHSSMPQSRVFNPYENDGKISRNWRSCGKSAREARALGCVFDLMMSTWIHPDCLDPKLMEEYLEAGNYTWYRDLSFTQRMSDEDARRGEYDQIFTRPDFHYAHCGYVWETQVRAYHTRGPVALDVYSYQHTVHCKDFLVDHNSPRNVTTLTAVFDLCGVPER